MVFCLFSYGPFSLVDVHSPGPSYRSPPLATYTFFCIFPCYLFCFVLVLVFSSGGILVAVGSSLQWYWSVSCLVDASLNSCYFGGAFCIKESSVAPYINPAACPSYPNVLGSKWRFNHRGISSIYYTYRVPS